MPAAPKAFAIASASALKPNSPSGGLENPLSHHEFRARSGARRANFGILAGAVAIAVNPFLTASGAVNTWFNLRWNPVSPSNEQSHPSDTNKAQGRLGTTASEGTPIHPVATTAATQQKVANGATAESETGTHGAVSSNLVSKWWTRVLSPRLVTPMSVVAICLLLAVAALANWFAKEQSFQAL